MSPLLCTEGRHKYVGKKFLIVYYNHRKILFSILLCRKGHFLPLLTLLDMHATRLQF